MKRLKFKKTNLSLSDKILSNPNNINDINTLIKEIVENIQTYDIKKITVSYKNLFKIRLGMKKTDNPPKTSKAKNLLSWKPIINLETAYVLIPNEGNLIPRKLITLAEFEANLDKYRQLIEFRVSGFTKKDAVTKPVSFEKSILTAPPVMAMAMEAA